MPDPYPYDYAVIRVVPKVERGEFLNVGVIVFCSAADFLEARIELDEKRLRAVDATLDMETLRAHLASISAVCTAGERAGPIGQLPQQERFHWLVAPRSTIIQTSPVHTGLCQNPAVVVEDLLDMLVRVSRVAAAPIVIRGGGDLASAVAHQLFSHGYRPVIVESPTPATTRRSMAFATAVFEGRVELEGVWAEHAETLDRVTDLLGQGGCVSVYTGPLATLLSALSPRVLIDARMRKRQIAENQIDHAPLVIGLGPGFSAGETVHCVIENQPRTESGHDHHQRQRRSLYRPADCDSGLRQGALYVCAKRRRFSDGSGRGAPQSGSVRSWDGLDRPSCTPRCPASFAV